MPRTNPILDASFFDRPADRVARELLGARLAVRAADGRVVRHVIVETEAYLGPHDLACHGSRGLTPRTATMFGPAGCWYVYLCYGMHWMLNIVTGREGVPAAVLIRGAGGHVGPGRVTKALGIDRSFDGRPASRPTGLWLEAGVTVPRRLVARTPRIGVAYAGAWAEKPLRFVVDPARFSVPDAPAPRMRGRQEPTPRPAAGRPAGRPARRPDRRTGRRIGRRIRRPRS